MGENLPSKEREESKEKLFIDRESEIKKLKNYILGLKDDKGKMVFIEGDAGVGKSKLLQNVKNFTERKKIRWYDSFCITKESRKYEPLKKTFNQKTEETKSTPSIMLKNSRSNNVDHHPISDTDQNILRNLDYLIKDFFIDVPCVFALEDIHLADRGTLSILNLLLERINSLPLLVTGTFRPEESDDNEILSDFLDNMKMKKNFEIMKITEFDFIETKRFIDSYFKNKTPSDFARTIYLRTGGNPLLIEETLQFLIENKELNFDQGKYPSRTDFIELPSPVEYLMERKLLRLSDDIKNNLKIASVLGDCFPYIFFQKMVNMSEIEFLDNLDELLEMNLLVENSERDLIGFKHNFLRDKIYREMSKASKRRLHLKVAKMINNITEETLNKKEVYIISHCYLYSCYPNNEEYFRRAEKRVETIEVLKGTDERITYLSDRLGNIPPDKYSTADVMEVIGDILSSYGSKMIKEDLESAPHFLDKAKYLFEKCKKKSKAQNCKKKIRSFTGR